MATRTLIRTATLAALAGLTAVGPMAPAVGVEAPQVVQAVGSDAGARFLQLGLGKSIVIDLPRDIKDVLVADPKVANAVIRSVRRAYVIGAGVGQTNVYFFDAEGKQIAGFDIAVTRDLNGIRAAIKSLLPSADIKVDGLGIEGIVLSGTAQSQAEAQQAFDIAARLLNVGTGPINTDGSKIVNAIIVRGRDQVMLKVTVAEVQRDVIKQLGIDIDGSLAFGATVLNLKTRNPFSSVGQPLSDSSVAGTIKSITSTLRAMDRAGVIRTLAEPTLTAISGENATFIAGGEFPIPSGLSCDTTRNPPLCQPQIDFKKFGVSLNFVPIVLSEGRISLKMLTEVSDLSTDNALTVQLPGSEQRLTIPSIRARRAETTIEIPSGGSLALAGMIQEQTKNQINGLPGLLQLPILGTLFKSRDYVNRTSELVIIVTPYIVRAVALKDLSRPDDGFADASDPAQILLGRFNRIYGVATKPEPPKGTYRGAYGFILD